MRIINDEESALKGINRAARHLSEGRTRRARIALRYAWKSLRLAKRDGRLCETAEMRFKEVQADIRRELDDWGWHPSDDGQGGRRWR